MEKQKTYNPLQYNIHPLDFIKKKTIEGLESTLKSSENGLSSSEKNHRASLEEQSRGLFNSEEEYRAYRRDFWDKSFPW